MSKYIYIYICIVFLLIILILLNTQTKKNKLQGGEEESEIDSLLENMDNIECTLEQIKRHNTEKDKWIYNNGSIYDLSPIIDTELFTTDINIINIIKFFKLSEEQDLSKIFKSIETYNNTMNDFNAKNPTKPIENTSLPATSAMPEAVESKNLDNKLETFNFGVLVASQFTEDNSENNEKNRLFDKFKFTFIKSITQFSKGIICPAGLKI